MPRVVIVGAGISGLSLAFRLQQLAPQIDVTILEADSHIGGCVRTDRLDGFTVECGPNGFLDSKPSTMQLARDVGAGNSLVQASESSARNRYLCLDRGLVRLPRGLWDVVRSPLLSVRGKLELFGEPFRRRRRGSHRESVDRFVRRRVGREVADLFADALVTGIYAADPKVLDVRAAFPRLVQLEADFGSIVRGMIRQAKPRGKLWSLNRGMGELPLRIAESLKTPPILGVRVRNVAKRDEGGWVVLGEGNDRWEADAVVLTMPASCQAELLLALDRELSALVGSIAHVPIAVVALGFRSESVPLNDGFGFIAPQRLRRDVLGVQWCSSIYPERAPAGFVLWRALCGGWNRRDIFHWPDERLVAAVRADLRSAQGVVAAPVFTHIVRRERAIAMYGLGHPERVSAIAARASQHPGLFLGGNSFHGVALNDCTEQAVILANRVITHLTC